MLQLQGGGVAGQRPQQGEGCSAPAQGRKRSPTRIHTSARLPQARREQVTSNYLLTEPGFYRIHLIRYLDSSRTGCGYGSGISTVNGSFLFGKFNEI